MFLSKFISQEPLNILETASVSLSFFCNFLLDINARIVNEKIHVEINL